jgi:hypothetical protein
MSGFVIVYSAIVMTEMFVQRSPADTGGDVVSAAQELVDAARAQVAKGSVEDVHIRKITLKPPGQPDTLIQIAVRETPDDPNGQLWVREVSGPVHRYNQLPSTADVTPKNIEHLTKKQDEAVVAQRLRVLTDLVTNGEEVSNSTFVIPRSEYRKPTEPKHSPRKLLEAAGTGTVRLFERARSTAATYRRAFRQAA